MNKHFISPSAALIAVLCFFLTPWVSCGTLQHWSGIDLATGASGGGRGAELMEDMPGPEATAWDDPLLFVVPLAGIAVIAIYFYFKQRNRLASALIPTITVVLLGLLVMGITFVKVQNFKSEFADTMRERSTGSSSSEKWGNLVGEMGIKVEWGYWLTAIAFVFAAVGATTFRDLPKTPSDITTPGTPMEMPPPGEVVSSEPPPDASMTEDKGMG